VPTYTKIHQVLTNPIYAGVYVYGKTRQERFVDDAGRVRKRIKKLPRDEWSVFIHDHHQGFIDWATVEANQNRLAQNTRPRPHQGGGAVREGAALLQGLALCGHCGRRLSVHYSGRYAAPGYHCAGKNIVNGRGEYCLNIGGVQIDKAFAETLLTAWSAHSDAKRPLFPIQSGHCFQSKAATESNLKRPLIPTQSGQSFWTCDRPRCVIPWGLASRLLERSEDAQRAIAHAKDTRRFTASCRPAVEAANYAPMTHISVLRTDYPGH
jgi:hypothetical protein